MAESTILEYLEEYGEKTFLELPFQDVDSLILCQLSYLKFDGLVGDVREQVPSVSLQEIAQHEKVEQLFADTRFEKHNRALFEKLRKSSRFGNMKLNCYINLVEKENETQFSAVTFLMDGGNVFVAFRGTDETIIGWKEDFNMAFLAPVPGQVYSVKYLNMVGKRLRGNFFVGGHSKGGNLAVYGAANCAPSIQSRIRKLYNMDGPGFRPGALQEEGYKRIEERVIKLLPRASVVGMVFEREENYRVVESKGIAVFQHDPYTWIVENGCFVEVEKLDAGQRLVDDAINDWALSLEEDQLKVLVNTLYQVVTASGAEDLISLMADWRKSLRGMLNALKEVDEQTQKMVRSILHGLFRAGRQQWRRKSPLKVIYKSKIAKDSKEGLQ